MLPETYELVLERVKEYGVPVIVLNHYGEPSLDPKLVDRIILAKQANLRVLLFSNASLLNEEKIRKLAEIGNTTLVVNLPTVDPDEHQRITGAKLLERVLKNLRLLRRYRLNTTLVLNLPFDMVPKEKRKLKYKVMMKTWMLAKFSVIENRAGLMLNTKYASPVFHTGKLNGCIRMLTKLPVNYDGKVFLCCQDYKQKYILGDLRESSIQQIAESPTTTQLRRWIFGGEVPPKDFICRRCEETQSRHSVDNYISIGGKTPQYSVWAGRLALLRQLNKVKIRFAFEPR